MQYKLIYAKRNLRAHLGDTFEDRAYYGAWLGNSYHEFISFCLFPLPFAVLIPFSGEICTCNSKMIVAAQVEKQWEKGVCFPKSKNKILELSLMCL